MYLIMAAKREKFHFHTHRHHLHVQLLNYDFPKSLSGLYRWLLMVYCSRSQCLNMEMLLGTLGVSLEDRQRFWRIGPPLFLQQNGLESKKLFKTHDKSCFLGPMFLISSTVFVELNCFWGQTNKKVSACLYFDIKMWKLRRP